MKPQSIEIRWPSEVYGGKASSKVHIDVLVYSLKAFSSGRRMVSATNYSLAL